MFALFASLLVISLMVSAISCWHYYRQYRHVRQRLLTVTKIQTDRKSVV